MSKDYIVGALTNEQMERLPIENVYWLLKRNQYSVLIGIAIQIGFYVLWQIAAIVPGFALFNGTAGQVSAYTHLAWWSVVEFLCICFGLCAVWFGLGYSTTQGGVIEKNVGSTQRWLQTYRFILALAGVAHIVHVVLSGIELHNNTSTLAMNYQWVLIVLIVLISISVLLVIWLIYRAHVYLKNLEAAMRRFEKPIDMTIFVPDAEQPQTEPSAPAVEGTTNSRITTPLLAQLQTNKRIVHKLK